MDKTTWENLPVGTNVLMTFPDQDPFTVIRMDEEGGLSTTYFGLCGGKNWTGVLDWQDHGAEFEVIFTPTSKEN